MPREHLRGPGYDFMDEQWCGGCETCEGIPCHDVCTGCSYDVSGNPVEAVMWPCPDIRLQRALADAFTAALGESSDPQLAESLVTAALPAITDIKTAVWDEAYRRALTTTGRPWPTPQTTSASPEGIP